MQRIFFNAFFRKEQFELSEGSRPWETLILLGDGAFSYTRKEKTVTVEAGQIAYFPANLPFSRRILSPLALYQFAFVFEENDRFRPDPQAFTLHLPKENGFLLAKKMDKIIPLPSPDGHLDAILAQILAEEELYTQAPASPVLDEALREVTEYMNENFHKRITLEELAALAHCSKGGLIRKFKRELKRTPADYLLWLRMRYAKQLLLEKDWKVYQVAAACGFEDPYYFSKVFSAFHKISPQKMRKEAPKA